MHIRIVFVFFVSLFSFVAEADSGTTERVHVKDLTEKYFKNISEGNLGLAYRSLSPELRANLAEERSKEQKSVFAQTAGDIVRLHISKLTVYDNPQNAPKPGIYIATDYYNKYAGVPIHCGYLVWFKGDAQKEYLITREETGFATADQLAGLSASKLKAIEKGLRCVVP